MCNFEYSLYFTCLLRSIWKCGMPCIIYLNAFRLISCNTHRDFQLSSFYNADLFIVGPILVEYC